MVYHQRAWRSRRAWRPFREWVATWLEQWKCGTDELIVIGPSGGHTLPTAWLRSFSRVHGYDLDPLAPLLFRLRHRGVRVHFERRDVFWRDDHLSLEPLTEILATHPAAAVLFSNVLGQVLVERDAPEGEWAAYLEALRHLLSPRAWASYHDRFTHEDRTVIDHLTGGEWSRGLSTTEGEWWLTPRSRHHIEGVYQSGPRETS